MTGTDAGRWDLRVGYLSDVGRVRKRNEDALAVLLPHRGVDVAGRHDALFLVADGMGGHEGGDVASAFVADSLRDWFVRILPDLGIPVSVGGGDHPGEPDPELAARIEARITQALVILLTWINDSLVDMATREGLAGGAGSTATVAYIRGEKLHVAHVGDTRLYRLRDRSLEQITEDHTWVELQRRLGHLQEADIATHPHRHMLTQCLGVGGGLDVFSRAISLRAGDRLLLSSDGLHGLVAHRVIAGVLEEEDPQAAADRLVQLANEHSGQDNITAVVVHMNAANSVHAEMSRGS